jgi:hypothetical protein
MTERDRDNLNFLLTVSPKVFQNWLDQADDDDVEYALELIHYAKMEMIIAELERRDEVEDVSLARKELDRIFGKAV